MAAATVANYLEINNPCMEVVQLTVTEGETYVCKKLGKITGAVISGNEDNDAHINVTFTGATATIHYAGMTDQLVTLTLFGTK